MNQPRRLLRLLTTVLVVLVLVGLTRVQAARSHTGYQGTITFYAWGYNPPSVTHPTPGQPNAPHFALQTLAHQWEQMHPGVHIKFVDMPQSNTDWTVYTTVLRTRLTGGTAPDIFFMWAQGNQGNVADTYLRAHLILDMAPYLNKPNPYIRGSKHWNDEFLPPWQEFGRTASGEYGAVPVEIGSSGVFYNKAITDKLGLHLPPASWSEFMQDLRKTKDAGDLPFGSAHVVSDWWFWGAVGSQFLQHDVVRFNVLKDEPGYIPGVVSTEEAARAVIKLGWRPSKDPGYVAAIRTFKDWMQYFAPGWASATYNPAQYFATGKLAFLWEGTQELQLLRQQKVSFPVGSFWLPPVTRQTSTEAPNPPMTPPGVGGYASGYGVAASLANSLKLPLVINFLHFITVPHNDAMLVNEVPQTLPAAAGAQGDPAIASLFKGEASLGKTGGNVPFCCLALTPSDGDKQNRYQVLYLQGNTAEQAFLAQMDQLAVHSAHDLVTQNDKATAKGGTWDLTKW